MINIHSWISQRADEAESNPHEQKYKVAFTDVNECDERGGWSSNYIRGIAQQVVSVAYSSSGVTLSIDNVEYSIRDLGDYNIPAGKILIDATSLALPELLHLFGMLNEGKKSFDVIYVQPTEYAKSETSELDKVKTFDLSDDGIGIQQIPPYIGYSEKTMIFFFLGWEGHRLGALINSEEFDSRNITCLIGAPPFKVGWENISLSNNYIQLSQISSSPNARFKFSGANDPVKTYEVIEQIYKAAVYERKNLCLAPFGTKPAAIAAAQFAVNKSNVVMLYDFVKKKNKRSSGTDLLHLWEFEYIEKK